MAFGYKWRHKITHILMPSRMLCKGCRNGHYRRLPLRRTANCPRGRYAELFTL